MQEVIPGVWHWAARHPEWTERATDWGPEVSSFAIDDGEHLLLFDPVAPPSLVDELAAARQPVVVLTCPWHRRDTADLVERLGAHVFVPPPDEGDPEPVRGHVFREGETLPFGVRAYAGMEENDLSLWIESRGIRSGTVPGTVPSSLPGTRPIRTRRGSSPRRRCRSSPRRSG